MFCPRCGAQVKDDNLFCTVCGAPLGQGLACQPTTRNRSRLPVVAIVAACVVVTCGVGALIIVPRFFQGFSDARQPTANGAENAAENQAPSNVQPEPEPAQPKPVQDPRALAQSVADGLVEGERSRGYSTYCIADVYGDDAEELLLEIKAEEGSGWTLYMFTFEDGPRLLYKGGFGYPDTRYEFYKQTNYFVAYGGAHAAEWFYSSSLDDVESEVYAQKTRYPASQFGGGDTDGPWQFMVEDAACDEAAYEQAIARIAQGPSVSVPGAGADGWELIYE